MITNRQNINPVIASWIMHNSYDGVNDNSNISVTTLIRPIRETLLNIKYPTTTSTVDVSELLASRMGTALHDSVEEYWNDPKNKDEITASLASLGVHGDLNLIQEVRKSYQIDDWVVSGKIDIILNGRLKDIKSTSVYGYVHKSNVTSYKLQASMYRVLFGDEVTSDLFDIIYMFTDWSKTETFKNPDYPVSRILEVPYALMPVDETIEYMRNKLTDITTYMGGPVEDYPMCTDEELWKTAPIYKVYKNDDSNRAMNGGTFQSPQDAEMFSMSKPGSVIKIISSKAKKCNYCSQRVNCTQYTQLVIRGEV